MKKPKILLIDDDPLFLSLTKKKLQTLPFLEKIRCITHVKDARDYLESCIAKETPFPDAIFVDMNMPGMSGTEFAGLYSQEYAAHFPETKLVILTSSISRREKMMAMEIPGVSDFMQKPLTEEKLNKLLLSSTC